jgi:hypothetical protein
MNWIAQDPMKDRILETVTDWILATLISFENIFFDLHIEFDLLVKASHLSMLLLQYRKFMCVYKHS